MIAPASIAVILALFQSAADAPPEEAVREQVVEGFVGTADDDAAEAIRRTVPLLETEGRAWITNSKCVSCHQITGMVWGLGAASQRGLLETADELNDSADWSLEQIMSADSPDTITQVLLGDATRGGRADRYEQRLAAAQYLTGMQQEDGSWKPGGQLPGQRRPAVETQTVTTIWGMLALRTVDGEHDDDPHFTGAMDRAMKWVHDNDLPLADVQSTEFLATRLLAEQAFGSAWLTLELRRELLHRQNDDGGWSWMRGEESDGYATGQALYALLRSGAHPEPALNRAASFLVASQRDDGAWNVRSTLTEQQHDHAPTSVYWGSSWAVIGLGEWLAHRE